MITDLISTPAEECLSSRHVVLPGNRWSSCLAMARPTTPGAQNVIGDMIARYIPRPTHHHLRQRGQISIRASDAADLELLPPLVW